MRRRLLPILPLAAFVVAWQVLSDSGLINRSLFPPPTKVVQELAALHLKEWPTRSLLLSHIATTVERLAVASLVGSFAGVLAGLLMGISRGVYRFVDPLITVLMPIPGIAMAPLFIVWLGFGSPTIVTLGAIAAFFPLAYNTASGVRSIDPQLVRAARIMGTSRRALLARVYLPSAAGHLLVGVKLSIARCWRTIIAVELVAAASFGIGYMIWDAAEYLRADVVYGGIVVLVFVYYVLEAGLIRTVERHTVEKWGMIRQ